jgi:hypothetical protein
MESDSNEIVRQLFEIVQVEFSILCDLERNDLLLIESAQTGVSQEALAAAAATVRSTLYTADALDDRIHELAARVRNR